MILFLYERIKHIKNHLRMGVKKEVEKDMEGGCDEEEELMGR
jgi:hypothetical protein